MNTRKGPPIVCLLRPRNQQPTRPFKGVGVSEWVNKFQGRSDIPASSRKRSAGVDRHGSQTF